ncbi:peptidoglycan binding domain-containing protein [Colletotrichum tofieldiae]|uniref:Peptidoglycan binding domain-containing protein n=1 Tax=Colletotrichum tofieldiae TaxID=708197 RepID=A0A166XSG9_9PEZI|nr:peptidoglycan binding domain-containing protein [Colletotrichum tofieldiae]
MASSHQGAHKRLIVCCDGTWMDSLGSKGAEPQSNVARISRVFRRTCQDGTHQIIMYHAGVGSSESIVDKFTGGMFGVGLDSSIREAYNFICTNYVDGDDIVLIGFSRGAFTARSVADMIATVGLLTPQGLDHFYRVFEDYESMGDIDRDSSLFLDPEMLPYQGEKGPAKVNWETRRKLQYKSWLSKNGLTRYTYRVSQVIHDITIKAVGVWDTVGTLGIPPAPVSDHVENAFHALALDEPRYAFRPALWEKLDDNRTNLKQVWFPGNHAGIGGGWHEQQIANITLAWMCDQLSSIGIEFNQGRMEDVFTEGLRYSAGHPFSYVHSSPWTSWPWSKQQLPWANPKICSVKASSIRRDETECDGKDHHPIGSEEELWKTARPWGLGQIRYPTSRLQTMTGTTIRHPGTFMRSDPETNEDTDQPLLNTNERIHSSVRVRLACQGLGMDDAEIWDCKPLTKDDKGSGLWKLERVPRMDASPGTSIKEARPKELDLDAEVYNARLYPVKKEDGQWRWVFADADKQRNAVPHARTLPEEPMMGYWEQYLLALTAGKPDVWRWAEENPPFGLI